MLVLSNGSWHMCCSIQAVFMLYYLRIPLTFIKLDNDQVFRSDRISSFYIVNWLVVILLNCELVYFNT